MLSFMGDFFRGRVLEISVAVISLSDFSGPITLASSPSK